MENNKIKRPEKLTVGGLPIRIKYVKNLIWKNENGEEFPVDGTFNYHKQEICIDDKDWGKEALWQCIFHEIFHSFYYIMKIPLLDITDENGKLIIDGEKHRDLDRLAKIVLDFLLRNKLIKI